MSAEAQTVVVGWKLDPMQRQTLLAQFPPAYSEPVADHVTLQSRVPPDTALPALCEAEIVGRVDDDNGVEAMIVSIGGTTDRPGGGTFHITWSLDDGRNARESNDAIAKFGWSALPWPIPVRLHPARFGA